MKAPKFRYFDPLTVDETLALLREFGGDAKVLAGGQTLGPMLNFRIATPAVLIDINRVAALDRHSFEPTGLRIGALSRQSKLEDEPMLPSAQPLVAAAIPFIAHRAIRNRGTVGGSLAHADPAAEWGALILALDATLKIGSAGKPPVTVVARDFFTGMLSTTIGPESLLEEILLPSWPSDAGWSFREISRRHGDFAVAGIACVLRLGKDARIEEARVVAFGVETNPTRLSRVEEFLLHEKSTAQTFAEAGRIATESVDPMADLQGPAEYRRHLLSVLVPESLAEAAAHRLAPTH